MEDNIVLYGNGGHAMVLKDLINKTGNTFVGLFDGHTGYDSEMYSEAQMIIAIGNNEIREKISKEVVHSFATLIHPTAVIGENVTIEEGTVVLANAVPA